MSEEREEQREQVVTSEIIGAARGYFLRFGYSRVSTGEIAKSIGRSKKTLYKHFATKEALLQAVLGRINQDVEAEVVEQIQGQGPFPDRLTVILERVAVHLASTSGTLFADLREKSPDLYQQMQDERRAALVSLLEGFIAAGVRAGAFRDDVNLRHVVTIFCTSVENLATPMDIATNAEAPEELFQTLVRMTVDGLRAR